MIIIITSSSSSCNNNNNHFCSSIKTRENVKRFNVASLLSQTSAEW